MRGLLLFAALATICLASDVPDVLQQFTSTHRDLVTAQINKEQMASYLYKAYNKYFKRADVALPGFANWFADSANEELKHADEIMDYLNLRGAGLVLRDIKLKDVCEILSQQLMQYPAIGRDQACICDFMTHDAVFTDTACRSDRGTWFNGLMAMQDALILERYVNQELLTLHQAVDGDPHLQHVLEHVFLEEQVDSIKKLGDYVTQLARVGAGLGEFTFDKTLQ